MGFGQFLLILKASRIVESSRFTPNIMIASFRVKPTSVVWMWRVFNTVNSIVFSFAANTSAQRDRSRVTPIRGRNILLCVVKARINISYKGIDESCKIYRVAVNIMKSSGQILWRLHVKIYFLIEIIHFSVLIFCSQILKPFFLSC